MIPASGSAYTYSYVVFGELIAWMIGVALILEYTLVVSAVAVGWSGYAAGFLKSVGGSACPMRLIQGPELGGISTCRRSSSSGSSPAC
jgi:APA family basic amino acid/polyamine antiporter